MLEARLETDRCFFLIFLLDTKNVRLGILVHLYLHSRERILVLAASSVGKRHRMVSNTGCGSVLILSKVDCSASRGRCLVCIFGFRFVGLLPTNAAKTSSE
ncbi:hypothetical protein HanRHA438_Chr16g0740711 [Helianthus annuus]|nr:hypothetical protein HanRHA438_Chr16g0740711 [Helianthus annuus]